MPHHARREHFIPLDDVSTLVDVARRWKRDKKTVSYAVDAGNIAARRVGRICLIYVPSVIAWWGNPPA